MVIHGTITLSHFLTVIDIEIRASNITPCECQVNLRIYTFSFVRYVVEISLQDIRAKNVIAADFLVSGYSPGEYLSDRMVLRNL